MYTGQIWLRDAGFRHCAAPSCLRTAPMNRAIAEIKVDAEGEGVQDVMIGRRAVLQRFCDW
jgi:hypothetical protein